MNQAYKEILSEENGFSPKIELEGAVTRDKLTLFMSKIK